jgi:hypothetical protein
MSLLPSKARYLLAVLVMALASGMLGASPALATSSAHGVARPQSATRGLHFVPAVTWTVDGTSTTYYRIENEDHLCLDAKSQHYPSDGDRVQLWPCNRNREQLWHWSSSTGNIFNIDSDYCLDANSKEYPNNHDAIQLWICNDNPEQVWDNVQKVSFQRIYNNGGFRHCLDANSVGYGRKGDSVQLWDCNVNSEQQWIIDPK